MITRAFPAGRGEQHFFPADDKAPPLVESANLGHSIARSLDDRSFDYPLAPLYNLPG
jgi:hypothetical protein